MKNKRNILILFLAAVMILAACDGSTEPAEPVEPTEAAAQTDASGDMQTPVTAEIDNDNNMAAGEVKTLYVGPELVECVGVTPQMCMQVKETADGAYQFFYNPIVGFTFEPGYEYELKVMVETVENPPADGSSLRYTLVEVVSKTAVTIETMPASTDAAPTLTGSLWTLTSYANGDGVLQDVLPETEVTAVFGEDGSLSGNAGCNSYNTSYQVDGSSITINEQIASTMMMCPEPVMQQETAYLANLTAPAAYEISGNSLTLTNAEGNAIAVFTVQAATPLTGSAWQVISYNNGHEAIVSVINGTTITAVFGEDGNVSGNASCNNYNAPYQVEGNNITIGMGMSTMMACMEPEGVMTQETAYLAALTTAAVYQIQGDILELRTADGALAVSYQAVDATTVSDATWIVTSYNNGRQAAVSPLLGTELTIELGEEGSVTGSAGCNRYFGAFTTDGAAVTVGPLATTRAYCPEPAGIMEQEQEFLAALQAAATFSIQNDLLDMRMADGAIAVMAVPHTSLPAEVQTMVENATFQNTVLASGQVTLADGVYTEPIADSAASMQVILLEPAAFGEVNGQPAAAVVLATQAGGTGVFIDLALVTFENGQANNVATLSLGDRVQVNSVAISDGVIVVDMVQHSETDPLCCPTQHVINTYSLQDGSLVETSSTPV